MAHTANAETEILPECHWCAEKIGLIAIWGNVGLAILKLSCGILGQSAALIADAAHSLVDVISAAVVWISLRFTASPPDEEHPYGHGHLEYVATLVIGLSLIAVVILIAYDSVKDIMAGVTHQPEMIALMALIISIAGNELMFRHSYCCGRRFGSPAMIANAWENRADVYSSLAALIGVAGAQLGFLFMDRVGAILVAILIGKSGCEMLHNAWMGFMDRSLDGSIRDEILEVANADPQVMGVVSLHTRALGSYQVIDLSVSVSPELTLHDGHAIAERLRDTLQERLRNARLITVRATGRQPAGARGIE